ncbi:MAG: energy-coupling factor ABC transporter permease [Fervidobacterium sp.]|nr:energy-coupling factor ABC transporter permease [Fervidobacterium sp.]
MIKLSVFVILTAFSSLSFSMHIAEGFLPIGWAAVWYIVSIPFVFFGMRKVSNFMKSDDRNIFRMAFIIGFVFVLSALKIPSVTGSCSHPTGIGLGAVVFGPFVMAVIGLVVLLFQALLIAHGGITTLGANIFSMAIVGSFVGYFVFKTLKRLKLNTNTSIFLTAFLSDLSTYAVTSAQLALAFPSSQGGFLLSLLKFGGVFLITQIPLAIFEGIISIFAYKFLMESLQTHEGSEQHEG